MNFVCGEWLLNMISSVFLSNHSLTRCWIYLVEALHLNLHPPQSNHQPLQPHLAGTF